MSLKKENARFDIDCGFNCAQAVFKQYCQEGGINSDLALKIASGFGGGMRMGKTCGAVTGGIMALGLLYGFSAGFEQSEKDSIQDMTAKFISMFRDAVGTTDCREILGLDTSLPGNREIAREMGLFQSKCPACISAAIDIIEEIGIDSIS